MSLQARALTLAKGDRELFANLSFTVAAGGALRVLGANGAGKTSLLRVLCGLSRPDEGDILWRGEHIRATGSPFCASLVYLGHADAVKHDLLAWENVVIGALLNSPVSREAACRSLAALGLEDQANLPARALSQGQRKRVALARLHLAPADSLWILDEPFSSLDAAAAAHLSTLLEAHCAGGGMVIYTSHLDDAVAGAATLALGRVPVAPC